MSTCPRRGHCLTQFLFEKRGGKHSPVGEISRLAVCPLPSSRPRYDTTPFVVVDRCAGYSSFVPVTFFRSTAVFVRTATTVHLCTHHVAQNADDRRSPAHKRRLFSNADTVRATRTATVLTKLTRLCSPPSRIRHLQQCCKSFVEIGIAHVSGTISAIEYLTHPPHVCK